MTESDKSPGSGLPAMRKEEKLNSANNFAEWRRFLSNHLNMRGLAAIVDGDHEIPCPPSKVADLSPDQVAIYRAWQTADRQAYALINHTLSRTLAQCLPSNLRDYHSPTPDSSFTAHSKLLFDWIKQHYSATRAARKLELLRQLVRVDLEEGGDVVEHVAKMTTAYNDLSEADVAIPDDIYALVILMSLPDKFEPIVSTILAQTDTPTSTEIYSHIQDAQARRELKEKSNELVKSQALALAASTKGGKGDKGGDKGSRRMGSDKGLYCSHHRVAGHDDSKCYALHPELAPSNWKGKGGKDAKETSNNNSNTSDGTASTSTPREQHTASLAAVSVSNYAPEYQSAYAAEAIPAQEFDDDSLEFNPVTASTPISSQKTRGRRNYGDITFGVPHSIIKLHAELTARRSGSDSSEPFSEESSSPVFTHKALLGARTILDTSIDVGANLYGPLISVSSPIVAPLIPLPELDPDDGSTSFPSPKLAMVVDVTDSSAEDHHQSEDPNPEGSNPIGQITFGDEGAWSDMESMENVGDPQVCQPSPEAYLVEVASQTVLSLMATQAEAHEFTVDTGATEHMVHDASLLTDIKPLHPPVEVLVANKARVPATGRGCLLLSDGFELKEVLLVPGFARNLISVGQMTASGRYIWVFVADKAYLKDAANDNVTVLEAERRRGLFILDAAPQGTQSEPMSMVAQTDLLFSWHRRLSHLNPADVVKLGKEGRLGNLDMWHKIKRTAVDEFSCSACLQGKGKRLPSPPSSMRSCEPNGILHVDLCGPITPLSVGGKAYMCTIYDDYTCKLAAYFLRHKSEAADAILNHIALVERKTSSKVKILRSDGGGEFCSNDFEGKMVKAGIEHVKTPPDAHTQNGRVERAHYTIMSLVRTLLVDAQLPMKYWAEAATYVVYSRNRSPAGPTHAIPEELWRNHKVGHIHMQAFGSHCFVRDHKQANKLKPRYMRGRFLSYQEGTENLRVLLPFGAVIVSRDVVFPKGPIHESRELALARMSLTKGDWEDVDPTELSVDLSTQAEPLAQQFDYDEALSIDGETMVPTVKTGDHDPPERQGEHRAEHQPAPQPEVEPRRNPLRSVRLPPDERPQPPPGPRTVQSQWPGWHLLQDDSQEGILRRELAEPHHDGEHPHADGEVPGETSSDAVDNALDTATLDPQVSAESIHALYGDTLPVVTEVDPTHIAQYRLLETLSRLPVSESTIQAEAHMVTGDSEGFTTLLACALEATATPQNFKDARDSPEWPRWEVAIKDELAKMERYQVWTAVPREKWMKVVPGRWVFNEKIDIKSGKPTMAKARWVAKGFKQVPGRDFNEIHSNVIHKDALRTFFAIVNYYDLDCHQVDIVAAFLNGEIEEEIYVDPPEGSGYPAGVVLRLRKTLYGLRQSPRCFNRSLDKFLKEEGLTPTKTDPCLYWRVRNGTLLLLALHVDDQLIAGSSLNELEDFKKRLNDKFECKDAGPVSYFLGVTVTRDRTHRKIWLSQELYIQAVAERFGITKVAKSVMTPLPSNFKPQEPTDEEFDEVKDFDYRARVGSVLYPSTITRPDIAYSASLLARYSSKWGPTHVEAVTHLIRYMLATKDWALVFDATASERTLLGYVDANWGGCLDTRRSTTGYVFKALGGAIAWKSRRQSTTALSTAEAEYMGLSDAARQTVWLRSLLTELNLCPKGPTTLLCDNEAAISLSKDAVQHERSKHIDMRHHFTREKHEDGTLRVVRVTSKENEADVFTKATTGANQHLVDKFMDVPPQELKTLT